MMWSFEMNDYDGTGEKPYSGDVAINNDKIVKVSKSIMVKEKKRLMHLD